MSKNLEPVHEKLRQISDESSKLSKQKYTASDIQKLQSELHEIDTKYSEGAFGTNEDGDRYEQQGQGQVADELERLHSNLRGMLERCK
jgi:ribosome-interacting GTPase 1